MTSDVSGPTSRRTLLTALGVAGGAGIVLGAIEALGLVGGADAQPLRLAAPSPSDFTLQGRSNDQSVVVLGAGIAGLTCGYELQKAGYDVTVIDASNRAGGRSWTVRGGDNYTDTNGEAQRCTYANDRWLNAGPARIAQHHTTMDYCRELGVPIEVFVNANVDAYIERGGIVRRRRSVIADHAGYVSELLAKSLRGDVLDEDLTDSEKGGLLSYLESVGALGRSSRGYDEAPGTDAGQIGEHDDLADILFLGLGDRVSFEQSWHQAMPMFHPVGGMDKLVDGLVAGLGAHRLVLGTAAAAVEETSSGVRVRHDDGSVTEADWGICATQPGIAVGLDNPWSRNVRDALQEPKSVRTGKIGLEYDARFWESEDRVFGGATITEPDVRVLWYPSTQYQAEGGVIMGAYPFGDFATRFGRRSHAEREALAVEHGERIHGSPYRDRLVSSFSVDWNSVEHVQAAWTSRGSYGAGYRLLQKPAGRWLFAGDWMSHTPGWQHGAFESARLAVATLHEQALAS